MRDVESADSGPLVVPKVYCCSDDGRDCVYPFGAVQCFRCNRYADADLPEPFVICRKCGAICDEYFRCQNSGCGFDNNGCSDVGDLFGGIDLDVFEDHSSYRSGDPFVLASTKFLKNVDVSGDDDSTVGKKRKKKVAKPKAIVKKARNFAVTVFAVKEDFTPSELAADLDWHGPKMWIDSDIPKFVTYFCGQLERCPESGKIHFQGYLECLGQQMYARLQSEIPGFRSAHLAPIRGTPAQNIAYCSKEGGLSSFMQFGKPKAPGKRNDLLMIKEFIDSNAPRKSLYDEHFSAMIRYGRALVEYKRYVSVKRRWLPPCLAFIGPSGTQKSTVVECLLDSGYFGPHYKLPEKSSGPWFDDYDGQSALWIDEFDGHRMTPTMFNSIFDAHECVVPAHGSAGHQLISKFHFLCSNFVPQHWWKKCRSESKSLQARRRLHGIWWTFKDTAPVLSSVVDSVPHVFDGAHFVPASQFKSAFKRRHESYTPHYHCGGRVLVGFEHFDRHDRAVCLCWNHLYDPLTGVCPPVSLVSDYGFFK